MIVNGSDVAAWADPNGVQVHWPDRPRLLELALARSVAESQPLRSALRYVIPQQLDPFGGVTGRATTSSSLGARAGWRPKVGAVGSEDAEQHRAELEHSRRRGGGDPNKPQDQSAPRAGVLTTVAGAQVPDQKGIESWEASNREMALTWLREAVAEVEALPEVLALEERFRPVAVNARARQRYEARVSEVLRQGPGLVAERSG